MNKVITFAEFVPLAEKRIKRCEEKLTALEVKLSTIEASIADIRQELGENISELFSQMEAARELLDEMGATDEETEGEPTGEPEVDEYVPEDESGLELELPEEGDESDS
ncbi:MAG: hypothetical protein ACRETA_04425 [Gammaproteobacteria bacterium]